MEVQSEDLPLPEPIPGWTEVLGTEATNPATPKGSGEVIHALGRDWRVSSLELAIRAQFEQWVRSNALKGITEAEGADGLGLEVGQQLRSAYLSDRAAGVYNWDGRAIRAALTDVPGLVHLLYLLIRRCHPEVTPEIVRDIFRSNPMDCGLALRWAQGNSKTPPLTDLAAGTPEPVPTAGGVSQTKEEILKALEQMRQAVARSA